MVQKSFFMYTSVSPPKHFFNIMNLVGIASHITCTFLSDYTINCHVYMLTSVYILILLHIFCLGMLGIDCGCRDMAWQINDLIFDWRLQWHHPQDLTSYETNIYARCLSTSTFLNIFYACTIPYSSYMYHCFIHMCYLSLTLLSNIECNQDHCNLFALNISVIVHFNFHSLYMLCLNHKYGSWHTRTASLETLVYSSLVCL